MAQLKFHNPETGKWEPAARVKLMGSQGVFARLLPADLPDYVRTEVMEVAYKALSAMTNDSIVFLAMSDTHYPGDETGAWNQVQNNINGLHTAMAAKALGYLLPLDFVAHLGDVGNGEGSTTPNMMKSQIQDFVSLFDESDGNIPCFIAIGNHDPGIYYHNAKADGTVYTLPGDWLYENFTAYSQSENTVFGGVENGGYCYRDFPKKKLRVFLLNSAEQIITDQLDYGTLPSQQLWVANALKNLGSKADAAQWGFIVLCHYPLDYGAARPISNVFKAYVNGESITVGGSTVSFSGYNGAKFLAQFHGHTHCFKTARLNGYDSSGTMTEYDAWRLAIPNVQYNRENYYTSPYNGILFCEDQSYPKTPNTANETSFVVNVVNPSEKVIHSFCYGAGYDRTVSLTGISYYSIGASLTGASLTGSATTVKEGDPYTGTITVADGYTLQSVVITMGGVDITSSVYSNGAISIPAVTGNVTVTVVAKAPPANLIRTALDTDGTSIFGEDYNGDGTKDGYMSGKRISSSYGDERDVAGMYASGFIPITRGDKLLLTNIGTAEVSYNSSMIVGYPHIQTGQYSALSGDINLTAAAKNPDGTLTIDTNALKTGVRYIRISCSYIGADSSVTIV